MRKLLDAMFFRHFAYHAARRWSSWQGAFNSAQFSTGLWLTFAIGLALTACFVGLTGLLPRQFNPLFGRDWVWWATLLPIWLASDKYIEKITDDYKDSTSADALERYRTPRERLVWLAQSLSTIAMVILMVWLRSLATG